MTEKHDFTEWSYCPDFPHNKYSRICKIYGAIEMSNNPCEIAK